MKPLSDDAAILKYAVYGLLGTAGVLKVVSVILGWVGKLGRGQVSSSGQARNASHFLSLASGAAAVSAVAIVLLAIGYWVSSAVRPAGFSVDDGPKGPGIIRFAIEVGVVMGAGVLAFVMTSSSGHRLVGFIALGVALAYGVFRALEFFGTARLGRLAARLSRGRLGDRTADAGAVGQDTSYAEHMREYRAGPQASTPKRGERAVSTTSTATSASAAEEHLIPATPARPLDEVLADIDRRIGLSEFKARLRRDLAYQKAERMKTDADPEYNSSHRKLHCVYSGPPGTPRGRADRRDPVRRAALHGRAAGPRR